MPSRGRRVFRDIDCAGHWPDRKHTITECTRMFRTLVYSTTATKKGRCIANMFLGGGNNQSFLICSMKA
jgi:hypothetical protein